MYDVFVGNLAWKVTSSDLSEFFGGENGNALRAEVVYHTNPRRPAGYGFVSFSSKEEVEAAIANYDGKVIPVTKTKLLPLSYCLLTCKLS